jgi:hypothetical protein
MMKVKKQLCSSFLTLKLEVNSTVVSVSVFLYCHVALAKCVLSISPDELLIAVVTNMVMIVSTTGRNILQ